ncbi:hypothetical protein [Caballeronia sp. AZ7_KS35]|uniref:hypothetical protein n=2 Tax=unclassified Caballeronia TaxID=2646786 RepID=UPI002028268F|nr:hypothetical protein [Caballeronia sp. AZ7_KS35]
MNVSDADSIAQQSTTYPHRIRPTAKPVNPGAGEADLAMRGATPPRQSYLFAYWLAPAGASLAAVAGKLAAAGADDPALSLAAVLPPLVLRLQPDVKQTDAVTAAINMALIVMVRFMACSSWTYRVKWRCVRPAAPMSVG